MDTSTPQASTSWKDAASAEWSTAEWPTSEWSTTEWPGIEWPGTEWPGTEWPTTEWSEEGPFKSNGESLYDGGDDFWSAVALPDWSNTPTAQRSRKPNDWCDGCQCEYPWPKNGYTFHVRSRRANAYLRSVQLAGEVSKINPMSVEPLEEVSGYRVSKDAHKMGQEPLKRLRGDGSRENSGGGCCFDMLVGVFLDHPGYASFQTRSNAEEFLSSAEGADAVTKWNEFFELIYKQHRNSFPTYYTTHTGGIPRYFYQRFPLLAEQAQWADHYGKADSNIPSHGKPSSSEGDKSTASQASRNRRASDRGGRRRHVKEQRQSVMNFNKTRQ